MEQKRTRFERVAAEFEAMSPLATLGRGYAIVRDENGRLLRTVDGLQPGTAVEIQLASGKIKAIIQETMEDDSST